MRARSIVHFAAFVALLALPFASAQAQTAGGPLKVLAAENFYGGIAAQIGGAHVSVSNIIANPDQDPHSFEATPGQVRQVADAKIVIFNGGHYDEWMEKLLKASPRKDRITVEAARVVKAKHGGNPHLWYAPATMPAVAKAIAAALTKADAAHAADYGANLDKVLADLERITQRVAQLRDKHKGKPVTATEPVFGLMAEVLGLTMRNEKFQMALMNESEPSARDIAAFETDLKTRKVKVLLYNSQVSEKLAQRLVDIAKEAKIPVVGVTETQPADKSFVDWMLSQLDALDKALDTQNS
ncbi:metal ABC transporter solute-binding protein, Zn/Mn family [Pseudolabrys sp. FHR47]|uniref:metal ABC transporter solute-binding protein, Zn/Mn family n=1 Tax=Pseudolabrys sp. FHR47 TaxID=2562284 RepID=UPI0010BEDF56|nr:zinc ABC transporter substrate-binding protein [Pseudolabrys sp. FHR47]